MHKLWMSIKKEVLLLKRDFGGLVILFVMPLVLIITITLIQDSTFKTVNDSKIPILLLDNDKGDVSKVISQNLNESNSFEIISELDENMAREAVFKGKYQLAIIIPKDLSKDLQSKVTQNVAKITAGFGLEDSTATKKTEQKIEPKEVKLYFDPASQNTFKNAVKSTIDKMISQIETKSIYAAFQEQLGEEATAFDLQLCVCGFD